MCWLIGTPHSCKHMHTPAGEREKERSLVSHTKEFELYPNGRRKLLLDVRQTQEMLGFVCAMGCSLCASVGNGLESREGCAGISQVRNSGQDCQGTGSVLPA